MAEEWRPVPGYEGRYEVSDQGRVRSLDRVVRTYNGGSYTRKGALMHPTKDTFGHLQVRLSPGKGKGQMFQVHRLVAMAFLGPRPDGLHTRHLNGDPTDNRAENLAFGTGAENQIDCYRYGKKSGGGRFNVEDVLAIRERIKAGERQKDIAKDYGVNQSAISDIHRGRHFSYIPAEGGAF